MPTYRDDPRDIIAKFGNCSICGRPVRGEEVLYFPRGRKVQCYVSQKCRSDNEKVKAAMYDEDMGL